MMRETITKHRFTVPSAYLPAGLTALRGEFTLPSDVKAATTSRTKELYCP